MMTKMGVVMTPNTPTLVQPNTTVPVGKDAISAKTSARIQNERVRVLNKFLILQLRDKRSLTNHSSLSTKRQKISYFNIQD